MKKIARTLRLLVVLNGIQFAALVAMAIVLVRREPAMAVAAPGPPPVSTSTETTAAAAPQIAAPGVAQIGYGSDSAPRLTPNGPVNLSPISPSASRAAGTVSIKTTAGESGGSPVSVSSRATDSRNDSRGGDYSARQNGGASVGAGGPQTSVAIVNGAAVQSGGGVPSVDSAKNSPQASDPAVLPVNVPDGTNSIPAVFEELDPQIAENPERMAQAKEIQDEFLRAIEGADGTIPDDIPLEQWLGAQWIADEKFRMRFGHEAWNAQQRRAAGAIGRDLLK